MEMASYAGTEIVSFKLNETILVPNQHSEAVPMIPEKKCPSVIEYIQIGTSYP
jgi:hypothetical protein